MTVQQTRKYKSIVVKLRNDDQSPPIGMRDWAVMHIHIPVGYNATTLTIYSKSPLGGWSNTGQEIDLSAKTLPADFDLPLERFGNSTIQLRTDNAGDNDTNVGIEVMSAKG